MLRGNILGETCPGATLSSDVTASTDQRFKPGILAERAGLVG